MSGIFGMFDPTGPDSERLQAAAARVSYRGKPIVGTCGPVAFGAFVRSERPGFLLTKQSAFIADARVDAPLPEARREMLESRDMGVAWLDSVMEHEGPAGLSHLAADFALARFDRALGTLTLSRDAFGLRPLYWAQHGARVAFACDPTILTALGLASGDLNREHVTAYLAMRDFGGPHTAFRGIRRVIGGRWITFDQKGQRQEGRWFRPEDFDEQDAGPEEFAHRLSDALVAAVASRAQGRRVSLLLSGGRDSGSVAVALARGGVRAACLTQRFDSNVGCSEEEPARQLADQLGHRWTACRAPVTAAPDDVTEFPRALGTPVALWGFPQLRSLRDAAAAVGADMVLDGQGGEPLFSAAPVAVLDLLRAGQIQMAVAAARAYRRRWVYPYGVLLKASVRAVLPRPLLKLRERLRTPPPWVEGLTPPTLDPVSAPTTAREHLQLALVAAGERVGLEGMERLFQGAGLEYACPLLDQRVVRVALALPLQCRAPLPGPKPLLARAFLKGIDGTRCKAQFGTYFARLAANMLKDFPWLAGPRSLSLALGYIRPKGLSELQDPRWQQGILPLFNLETWLRANAS